MKAILPFVLNATAALSGAPGIWELTIDDTTIFRFELQDTQNGAVATWERPEHFRFDGDTFSKVTGPVVRRRAVSVKSVGDDLQLSFDDPAPDATPDVFRFHRVDADHASVTYEGMEPFHLVRSASQPESMGNWDPSRSYAPATLRSTNAEMTAIFDADQADRKAANIDWSKVGPADERRLTRTKELLADGALQSGDDFEHAAFVFQHGSEPNDFLQAHLLAMIAVARGKPSALWIASATLDRYLQKIGRPQVLGTQYSLPNGAAVTQEPYDRTLVPDTMRKALRVRTLSEQEEQRRQMSERRSTTK